jgi:TonB family protein
MNRLQKKCLIATASGHLLLLLILLVGPGFFTSKPKPDDTELLDVIPSTLVDAAFSSGVKDAQAPPLNPTPMVQPPTPQPPTPQPPQPPQPQPKPAVQPPEPKPTPVKQPDAEPAQDEDKPSPDSLEPAVKPVKPKPHVINVDLGKKVVHKVSPKDTAAAERAAEKAAAIAEENAARAAAASRAKSLAKAFSGVTSYINGHSSSSTSVEMPGNGSVSYASYASAVKTIYEHAWASFDDAAIDHDVVTTVSVTIARDGRVLSSHIVDRSGDTQVDTSVRRTLDSVDFVAPFPEGATEKERTFTIKFDHKAKRMLG